MDYLFDRETYLRLKELQKLTAEDGKDYRIQHTKYLQARRDFYHGKSMNVPSSYYGWSKTEQNYVNLDKEAGFIYNGEYGETKGYANARYLNIIYGIVKGKPYNKIEQKVEKGNEVDTYTLKACCNDLGVDWEKIRDIVWAKQSK